MENFHNHEVFMRHCIALAEESQQGGDLPFGAVVVLNGNVIAESKNTAVTLRDITGHAEANVLKEVFRSFPELDFSACTLYSNFEPCAMCSFLIRDIGIGSVVYGVHSPHLGGYTRWDILSRSSLRPEFTTGLSGKPPVVIGGVCADEISATFDRLSWKMHHAE